MLNLRALISSSLRHYKYKRNHNHTQHRNGNASSIVAAAAILTASAAGVKVQKVHKTQEGDADADTRQQGRRRQRQRDDYNGDDTSNGERTLTYRISPNSNHWLTDKFNFNYSHSPPLCQCQCQCESTPTKPPIKSKLSLQRRSTLLRLNESSRPITNLNAKYDVSWKTPLGEGAFSTVFVASDRRTSSKVQVAIKKIPKMFTDNASFQNEIDALLHIQENGGHPHICSLKETFEDDKNYYLVLDLVTGGEMFEHLIKLGAYSEATAARLIREAAAALCFIHGINLVHGDLKPENLMLSTDRSEDGTIQLVDFGCAYIRNDNDNDDNDDDGDNGNNGSSSGSGSGSGSSSDNSQGKKIIGGNTPAYCPPEALVRTNVDPLHPSMDMWSLGIILFIMLTGLHPYDLNGNATDEEIEFRIRTRESPPLKNSPITAHLSPSAIDVIEKCMKWDADERITAQQLLEHPWVKGETASEDEIADAVKKLRMYHPFKSKLEAQVFADFFSWSGGDGDSVSKKTSLIERAFNSIDVNNQGFLTSDDLKRHCTKGSGANESNANQGGDEGEEDKTMSLSGFSNLLGTNMKNKYFPRGMKVYTEGDEGNHMYFINSGIVEVTTKDGSCVVRRQGDFFGEGALLNPKKIRSASIRCLTPVHAIEISRDYFEKYVASSGLSMDLKEKDKTRKRNRAKTILRLQKNLKALTLHEGFTVFREGEDANALYILESGHVDVFVDNKKVFAVKPGDIFGEHSMIMGRPRNTSATCMSKECVVQEMKARDFYEIYNSSSTIKGPLRELCLRREFQKALVKKTKKEFPSVNDLREVFDAADIGKTGSLNHDEAKALLTSFDPSLSEQEIKEAVQTLDLDESGNISFDEFRLIFGMNEVQASSI